MRYCFLTYGRWPGNQGQMRPRHLGSALLDRGVDVTYVVDDFPDNREHLDLDVRADVRFVPTPRGPRQILSRRRVLRALNPDVVHVLNPHAKTYAAVFGRPTMYVVAEWDEPPVLRAHGWLRHGLDCWLDRWLRHRADQIIACTRAVQRRFATHHALEAAYIPHGTYLGQFTLSTSPFREPTAVVLGTFDPAWDHDLLFDALRLLAARDRNPRVEFIGEGQDLERWQTFCSQHELGNVVFTGWMQSDDLKRHLQHAHVLLFAIRDTELNRSRCPSKLFAFAQAGRPVITCRVGEVPEVLGDLPTYVEATPAAFATAIEEATDLAAVPAVDYESERHSYADRAERLLSVLDRAAANRPLSS